MKSTVIVWVLLLLLGLTPWLVVLGFGFYALWQQQAMILWLSATTSISVIVWIIGHHFRPRQKKLITELPTAEPDFHLSPKDQDALLKVQQHSAALLQQKNPPITEAQTWLNLGREMIGVVARHYKPQASRPELDIPLPYLLLIAEKVSHDLCVVLSEHVPGSHMITLSAGLNLWEWSQRLRNAHTLIKLGRTVTDPFGSLLTEARAFFQGKVSDLTVPVLRDWLLKYYLEKVGYYAILLYSGRIAVPTYRVEQLSQVSANALDESDQSDRSQQQEPLRMLVVGQVNAGKSSLINGLFGELRAATDSIACTDDITPYRLQHEGNFEGLILDTPGYGDADNTLLNQTQVLEKTDLIILACAADKAGRSADERFLRGLRSYFLSQTERAMPALVVAITHIDKLRPLQEWEPPYDVENPQRSKEHNIRALMDIIVDELQLDDNTPVVPVCYPEDYNLDGLWVAIGGQLEAAKRAKLLRCLKDAKAQLKWQQLGKQFANLGRKILDR